LASSFPASYDALTNPSAGSLLTSPSHSSQHTNANDILEAVEQRVGLSGSSFPGSPSSGQFFHHTTRRQNYYYDGTRWLSDVIYQMPVGAGDAVGAISASGNLSRAPVPPLSSNADVWLEQAVCHFYVGGGGTALGASHKWVGVLEKLEDGGAGSSGTAIATFNVDSGASDAFRQTSVNINALMNNGTTHVGLAVDWTKTGTPGTLRAFVVLTYRLVG
jgi:hypothetical protein